MQHHKYAVIGMAAIAGLIANSPAMAKKKPTGQPAPTVSSVVVYLKQELALFNKPDRKLPQITGENGMPPPCKGNIELEISRFDVSMSTTSNSSGEAGIEATVPLGSASAVGSFGKGNSASFGSTLNLSLLPAAEKAAGDANNLSVAQKRQQAIEAFAKADAAADQYLMVKSQGIPTDKRLFKKGAIANALIDLETSLRSAGTVSPCFTLTPSDDADQSITLGFTLSKERKSGFEFSFLFFSIGASKSKGTENINTVTVHFVPKGNKPVLMQ